MSCSSPGGELPSVAAIAVAAGLAKSTVHLYFRTKGEIFACILQDGWGEVIGELDRTFRPEHGARAAKIAVSLSNYVEWGQSHPELLQLDSLGHGVLERNLGAETLVAFKQALQERLTSGASILEVAFGLQPGRGLQLLTRTYAMTRGSWQSFDHSQHPPGQPLNPFGRSFATERLDALSECRRDALA